MTDQVSPLRATATNGHIDDGDRLENGVAKLPLGSGPRNRVLRRTRSLNAPSPIQQFGPCGRIMKNSAMVMTIQDPASQRLTWYKPPLTVLVIKKIRDSSVLPPFVQLVTWLIEEKRMVVFVEASVLEDPALARDPRFQVVRDRLQTFRDGTDDLQDRIDFIVCLGGDGTLLYASLLFQQSVPPVMAFHLGSLGFLTPFEFDNFQEQVTNVLEGREDLGIPNNALPVTQRYDVPSAMTQTIEVSQQDMYTVTEPCSHSDGRCKIGAEKDEQKSSCLENIDECQRHCTAPTSSLAMEDLKTNQSDEATATQMSEKDQIDADRPAQTSQSDDANDSSASRLNDSEKESKSGPLDKNKNRVAFSRVRDIVRCFVVDSDNNKSIGPNDNDNSINSQEQSSTDNEDHPIIRAATTECSHAALTLRSRLRCIIMRKGEDGLPAKPPTNLLVLNEVVVDRGPSPYLSNIDLFIDGKHVTSVQGDGLIVSTPTGSTAYAVAAGASMIHPSVPAIMVTPICPHSLSFRPIVVPAGVELKIMANSKARSTAYVSFDGRNQQELRVGDSLRVTTSIYPVPSICAADQITDWFDSLAECLHWNVRKRQKHLDELSDLTHSSSNDTLDSLDRDS